MRQAQQQDPQDTGVMPWDKLLQILQKLSQDCLGFTATALACMLGHAAQDAAQVVQYSQCLPAVAAQVLSYINPRMTATRLAAMNEYRQRDASEKKRGNEQLIQVRYTNWDAVVPAQLQYWSGVKQQHQRVPLYWLRFCCPCHSRHHSPLDLERSLCFLCCELYRLRNTPFHHPLIQIAVANKSELC